jgi:hypothetical protein
MAGVDVYFVAQLVWYAFAAFSAGYSLVSAYQASHLKTHYDQPLTTREGQLVNTCDNKVPMPLVYGHTRVGINRVYCGVSGTDNKFLHIIGNICEGEIEGFYQVGGVDQLFLGDRLWNTYICNFPGCTGHVHYELFTGSADQTVCATLKAAIPEWNDPKKNTAYIYVRLYFNQDLFQGLPDITLEIEGLKIYNPSTQLTAYSNNPALVARDFITRSSKRGGMGVAVSRIDDDLVISAASYCDTKGWICDICLNGNASAIDLLQHILATFRGNLVYSDSTFKLLYADLNYESAVMEITEDDIIEQGKSTLRVVQPSIFSTPNAIKCRYTNAEKKYTLDDYILSDPDAIAEDGDYREWSAELIGMTSQANVMKMANYLLERARINKAANLIMGSRGMALEPHDLITLTHTRPGWDNKIFRVNSASLNYDGSVGIGLDEEYAATYDDIYEISEQVWHDTTLPNPRDPVVGVINVSHSEEVYYYRNRSFTRWKIDFDPPSTAVYPWWDYANIYVKIGEAGDWKYMTKSGGDYQFDPVEEGETYYCCIVSVSIFGTSQAFTSGTVVSKTIIGPTGSPSDLSYITALSHGDTVSVFGNELSEPDIAGYELRLGAGWDGGIFMAFNETPNWRLVGIRPGTHTFWAKAKTNAGIYSDNAVSATAIVYYPSNYVEIDSWAWDFDAIGDFDNTEHTTYEASDALMCSHTASVLTGTWTSPEYDLGSEITCRIWGDFDSAMEYAGGTWAALLPTPMLWSDKLTAATRWRDLLSPDYAGKVQATLYWGSVTEELTESADYFEILAPEITARYVQVVITITDPDEASYMYLKTLNMTVAYWS